MAFKVKFSNMGLKVNRGADGELGICGETFYEEEAITVYGVQEIEGDTLFLLYAGERWTWEHSSHYEPYVPFDESE